MFTYRNTAAVTYFVINVGRVDPQKTIHSPVELNHPDLQLVVTKKEPVNKQN